jgi:biotin operon repressor
MNPYPPEIETLMKKVYQTLSEKDRRRYAAIEALKLGHGGQRYIAELLGCSRNTVAEGIKELEGLPEDSGYERRVRRVGGGRNRYGDTYPGIDAQFLDVLSDHTAGDPMNEQIRWTNLSRQAIADRLAERYGVRVSVTVIKQLMKTHHYRLRKAQKKSP